MKNLEKRLPECYDSLDAPIYIWSKIHESNDLSWLLVKRKKINGQIMSKLEKVWERIYEAYISEFGFSENFIEIKKKEIEIARLKIDFILTKDMTQLTWIEIAEQELKELKAVIGKANFMESKIAIENKFKFQINMQQTSIREFYSYIKHLT